MAALLTAELRSCGVIDATARVSKVVEKKSLGGNDDGRLGVLSCIFRIKVEYEGTSTGPASMIYKTSPLTPDFYGLRGLCKGMRAFEIEVKGYNGGFAFVPEQMPVPKGYFAAWDPESSRYQLLLEDLNARSETMEPGDQIAGLSNAQVGSAITAFKAAAKLHASFWNVTKAKGTAEWAKELDEPFWPTVFPMMYNATWAALQETLATHSDPQLQSVRQMF